jgi:4'-phosphopantetheinyl transferase EntD
MDIVAHPDPAVLSDAERALFVTLGTERRRCEWWCGRVVARAALEELGARALSVVADDRGAPKIVGPSADSFFVSIAHGRRVAAAIAAASSAPYPFVGVDIVDPEDRPRLERLEGRVLTEDERLLAREDPDLRILAWAAREAVAKATSTGMFAFALKRIAVRNIDHATRVIDLGLPDVRGVFEPLDGGFIVLAGCSREVYERARREAFP